MNNEPEKIEQESLTRREWLLRLGDMVVLVGFSGVAAKPETGTDSALCLLDSGPPALPPGLYLPSNDHLSHALTNDAQFHAVPAGSETDYVRPRGGPFQPRFFSPSEFQTVRRIVELMLGETLESSNVGHTDKGDSPEIVDEVAEWIDLTVYSAAGIREAARRLAPEHRILAVHYYGARAVEQVENNDPQKTCQEGLGWLEEESERRYGKPFLHLSDDQQLELLRFISDDRPQKTTENAGTRFCLLVKGAVIHGFYTSRAGLKELDYKGNSFYAESPGCKHAQTSPNKAS